MLGMLLGIAVRTGSPLNLNLAEPAWKQLAGMKLSVTDLNEIDKDYVPGAFLFHYECLFHFLAFSYLSFHFLFPICNILTRCLI